MSDGLTPESGPGSLRPEAWDSYWETIRDRLGAGPGGFARWSLDYLSKYAPGPRVLELGSGAGRDLKFFAEAGFEVDGVDSSAVAVELARTTISSLSDTIRARINLLQEDALAYLDRQAPDSYDSVVGIVLYETMTDDELERLFSRICSCLRPRGLHLWCVRASNYPLRDQPWLIPPNQGRYGAWLPHRLFSSQETERLIQGRFERLGYEDVSERHYLYIADRRQSQETT
jgi:cyclopropane fatty-acyl-phospholipid synthase-like methyltransferase